MSLVCVLQLVLEGIKYVIWTSELEFGKVTEPMANKSGL